MRCVDGSSLSILRTLDPAICDIQVAGKGMSLYRAVASDIRFPDSGGLCCSGLVWISVLSTPLTQILAAVVDQACSSISDGDFDSSIINSWLRTVLAYRSGRFLVSKLSV